MAPRLFLKRIATRAPGISGAVFCAAIALSLAACEKKEATADWNTPGDRPDSEAVATPTATPKPEALPVPETTSAAGGSSSLATPEPASSPATNGLRFAAFNVENWLTMDRYVDRKPVGSSPKPDSEKQAVIRLIHDQKPDVLGICEIGTADDLAEVQEMLAASGWNLPHLHYIGGSDPVRHLGVLSRFPITSTAKPAETEFQLQGQPYAINRGILDATIEARGKSYRFLGVHLKSKREVEYADQEEMRVNEGRLLRRHVDAILKQDPAARLIVYGDFNDTRPSKAFKTVTGSYNDPGYLTAIPFKDSNGDAWTHYWEYQDIYSRIDFVAVSQALKPEVDFQASYIVDAPDWNKASDHRMVIAIFK